MSQYGITEKGFAIKPFQVILEDKAARAREIFGADLDLRPTSAIRKLLDIASYEDHELWKGMEQFYYSNFISTASGMGLDLLGEDLGVSRRLLKAAGQVKFKLSQEEPGRIYHFPIGTRVETDPPVQRFRTLALFSLSSDNKEATVPVEALERGIKGNVAANAINKITASYAQRYLNLGSAQVEVKNEQPTSGGEVPEPDASFQAFLLGYPRTLWTLEAVRHVVKNLDGVRDCRLFDRQGGVDVSLSIFNVFKFGRRRFGIQRLIGTPYYFDILVAIYPGFFWESEGGVPGVKQAVEQAIKEVRPVSIFPNLILANHVFIGIRAKILIKSGHDKSAILSSIKERLDLRINSLGLNGSVLYSDVMLDCKVAKVVDVQQLHLRRCPPVFSTVCFGSPQRFQAESIEAPIGENIYLKSNEIAIFKIDSDLIDLEIIDQ